MNLHLTTLPARSIKEIGHGGQVTQRALKSAYVNCGPPWSPFRLAVHPRGTRLRVSCLNDGNTNAKRFPHSPGALLVLFNYPSVLGYHQLYSSIVRAIIIYIMVTPGTHCLEESPDDIDILLCSMPTRPPTSTRFRSDCSASCPPPRSKA